MAEIQAATPVVQANSLTHDDRMAAEQVLRLSSEAANKVPAQAQNEATMVKTAIEPVHQALHPVLSNLASQDQSDLAAAAAEREALIPAVIVDSSTQHHELGETENGETPPLILTSSERPTDDVLQNVVNFRDVGKNYNKDAGESWLKEDIFFRSGRLDDACTSDLEILTTKYSIRTVVDLRSETEGNMGEDLVNTFPASLINEHLHFSVKPRAKQSQHSKNVRQTFYVNFAGFQFRQKFVWNPLRFRTKIRVIGMMAKGKKGEVVELIGRQVIQPRGLAGLNEGFVDYCGHEIVQALKLMTESERFPLLVHCTQGKDRTGLVVAMALAVCGIAEEFILKDYERTQQGLSRQRDVMVEEMRRTGLDSTFSDAPREVLQQTFHYIRKHYGTPLAFLQKHGFTPEDAALLRKALIREDRVVEITPDCQRISPPNPLAPAHPVAA